MIFPGVLLSQTRTVISDPAGVFNQQQIDALKGQPPLEPVKGSVDIPNVGDPCGWTNGTATPSPLLDQAITVLDGNLYSFAGVIGGVIAAGSSKFDGTTWTPIAPTPVALEWPSAVNDGTNIYVMAGADTTGASTNGLYKYDPVADTYTPLASSPSSTWNQAAVYLNGKIYKVGGSTAAGVYTSAFEIYDIATNTWSAGASYPIVGGFIHLWAFNNAIWAAGGVGPSSASSLKTYKYDPGTNTWDDAAFADLPADRWGGAFAVYRDKFVIAGGYVGAAGGTISNTAIQYDPATNAWTSLPNLAEVRSRASAGVLNGFFYMPGGRGPAGGFAGTSTNYTLFCPPLTEPFLVGSVTYVSDDGTPVNGVPDPGETVTVSLEVTNVGGGVSGNVTATLEATGGITNPSGPVAYGVLNPGQSVSHEFTFQVPGSAACGGSITLTFQLTDGTVSSSETQDYTLGILQEVVLATFDDVTAPTLPSGWTTAFSGNAPGFITTTAVADSPPNSAFAPDLAGIGVSDLISTPVAVTSSAATLHFRNNHITETNFDGMVLEIKIGSGEFQDIITAGGTFIAGGYNSTISTGFQSPIGGRQAWSGNSNGFKDSSVTLPPAAVGQTVQFLWKMATDISVASTGVYIDGVRLSTEYLCSTPGAGTGSARADYDGDGRTDVSVFRPSEGNWYIDQSTDGFIGLNFGLAADTLVPGDYDGDGKTDVAVFRPIDTDGADFYVLKSSDFTVMGAAWGLTGDVPVTGDYDGDGSDDFGIYRPSDNTWYVLTQTGGNIITPFGEAGDTPAPGDYDGDGTTDMAVYGGGSWSGILSGGGVFDVAFGAAGDVYVPGDYDGDGETDLAVYRPSNGTWYVINSGTGSTTATQFGISTDLPVPGDYDGDGSEDIAVYRSGTWWILGSTDGVYAASFGTASDKPTPASARP